MDISQRNAMWRWIGLENTVESSLLSTRQRPSPLGIPVAKQSRRNAVATLPTRHRLCATDHVGLADRVLHRYCAVVRSVPAHQLIAFHHPNSAVAAHQVR